MQPRRATVGRIDDEQMFYLRSRGINQQAAQQMILYAFAAELTEALLSDEGLRTAGAGPYRSTFAGRCKMTFSVDKVRGRLSGAFA